MSGSVENLRNIALVGGQGMGKTSLAEAILFQAKIVSRMGSVEQGSTVSDYDTVEKERRFSVNPSLLSLSWQDRKINVIDCPGFPDFIEKTIPVLRVVESALFVISPLSEGGGETQKLRQYVLRERVPCCVFVNKLDEAKVDLRALVNDIEKKFGLPCVPLQIPLVQDGNLAGVVDLIRLKGALYEKGKSSEIEVPEGVSETEEYRRKLLETVAETDDALIEKYLEEEDLEEGEIKKGLRDGFAGRTFVPLVCGSATRSVGIDLLLDLMVEFFPSPLSKSPVKGSSPREEGEVERKIDPGEALSVFVFQTLSEAHLGEMNVFKVFSGTLSSGSMVHNSSKGKEEKIGQLCLLRGSSRSEISEVSAGDIGAVAKLRDTDTADTFSQKNKPIVFAPFDFSEPASSLALKPKQEKDEQKMSTALARLVKVDPLLKVSVDRESGQTILSGTGEVHLEVAIERLRRDFNVEVETAEPQIPYRETILVASEAQGRHKKQSGGRGQYGDVWLRIKPLPRGEGIEFVTKIKGGVVPSRFIPAVKKGVTKATKKGVLASYPLVDVEVTLFDGTYHPVDSSDIAFQIAGAIGLKKAVEQAKAILLEPILELEVQVPEEFLGETNGDLNSRRGRILEVEHFEGGGRIKASVPQAELHNYSAVLRSITQGRGTFTRRFSHYEKVPDEITQKIISQAKEAKQK